MRKLLLVLAIMVPCLSFAQSVMGIELGSSYETTKSLLERRFGKSYVFEEQGGLVIYNCKMGDIEFNIGKFFFQYDGDKSYFNEANFTMYSSKDDVQNMKGTRDYLYSLLKDKYKDEYLEEFINDQGFKCYRFGSNPKDKDHVLGGIYLTRDKGEDGIERLYLYLVYLPIYFIDKASDF